MCKRIRPVRTLQTAHVPLALSRPRSRDPESPQAQEAGSGLIGSVAAPLQCKLSQLTKRSSNVG